MKKFLFTVVVGIAIGLGLAWKWFSGKEAEFERERAGWEKTRTELEAAAHATVSPETLEPTIIEKKQTVKVIAPQDPAEILAALRTIKINSGPAQTRNTRIAIQHFENLIATGTNALPVIREFLSRNEEVDYDSWISPRASRDGKIAIDFTLPPSLRFGLFDATRQIGGEAAEKVLVEILSSTGRGAEVAYLARVLQEMAPFKYRDIAVNAARELLRQPVNSANVGLDKYDREYLFAVLAFYGDTSLAGEAQGQIARTDGTIDRGILKYLQQTLGEQALPTIAQAYRDGNIAATNKEPLGRFALNFAGSNLQADDLWHTSIMDKNLSLDARRELIEDLNQDGYDNLKSPTARDLMIMTNRLALIDRFRAESDHKVISGAFDEAEKDLRKMIQKYTAPPVQ